MDKVECERGRSDIEQHSVRVDDDVCAWYGDAGEFCRQECKDGDEDVVDGTEETDEG